MKVSEINDLLEEYKKHAGLWRNLGFTHPAIKALKDLLSGKDPRDTVPTKELLDWFLQNMACHWSLEENRTKSCTIVGLGIVQAVLSSKTETIEHEQLQQVQEELTNLILSFDDLNFLLKDGLQDTIKQLLFHSTKGERLRASIQSLDNLMAVLRFCPDLAEGLLLHPTDGPKFTALVKDFPDLQTVLAIYPSIAQKLLFRSTEASRLRWLIPHRIFPVIDMLRIYPDLTRDLFSPSTDKARFQLLIQGSFELKAVLETCPNTARPDLARDLLLHSTQGARFRELIRDFFILKDLLTVCPDLARDLLFHPTDGERFRELIGSFQNLTTLLKICPDLARELLFHPTEGERFRASIWYGSQLTDILDICPGLARDLLFHPTEGRRFTTLIQNSNDLVTVLQTCPDIAQNLFLCHAESERFQRLIKGESNAEALGNFKTLIGLCPDITASLVRLSLVINLENFFQENPSTTTNFEILEKLIDLSLTYQNLPEMGASTLFLLPELNNPDSLSTLAHAIVLTGFPVFQESQRSLLQPAEKEQEQSPPLIQIKIENLLMAAQLLISEILLLEKSHQEISSPEETGRKVKERIPRQNNILTLMKVWLRQIQQILLAQQSLHQAMFPNVTLDSEKTIEETTKQIDVVLTEFHVFPKTKEMTKENAEALRESLKKKETTETHHQNTALQSPTSQTNGTPATLASVSTTTPFSDMPHRNPSSTSGSLEKPNHP